MTYSARSGIVPPVGIAPTGGFAMPGPRTGRSPVKSDIVDKPDVTVISSSIGQVGHIGQKGHNVHTGQNGQTFGIWSDDPFRADQPTSVKPAQGGSFRRDTVTPTESAQACQNTVKSPGWVMLERLALEGQALADREWLADYASRYNVDDVDYFRRVAQDLRNGWKPDIPVIVPKAADMDKVG